MNERIKQIAYEAGQGGHSWYNDPNCIQAFAELIVAECAMFVVVELEGQVGSLIADRTANRLEEHFGVEE